MLKTIELEGAAIKGCKYIYAPKGQAGEYSELATNPYRGCGHGCAYCYVPNITRMDRRDFNSSATLRNGYLNGVKRDAEKYSRIGSKAQIMLSFTSDPYHPFDTMPTRSVLNMLNHFDLSFCTLTKGGTKAIRDIDLFDSSKDSFACTLTSLDDNFSKKWEPSAALPGDRIEALRRFHEKGIFTWVSLEPTLDVNATKEIILHCKDFVDLFKIGRVNYLPMAKTTDWESYTHEVIDLCQKYDIKHYIKKDLQCYLPDGYDNPLRVKQHH